MTDSLYSRLGGYDGIAMFATTLVGQARKDEVLSRFWANRGEDRIARDMVLSTRVWGSLRLTGCVSSGS